MTASSRISKSYIREDKEHASSLASSVVFISLKPLFDESEHGLLLKSRPEQVDDEAALSLSSFLKSE